MTAVAANPPNPNLLGVGPMPARSQSFRHRRQTQPKDGDKSPLAGGSVSPRPGQHRRKSTPNVQRQASGRNVNAANRLDVWPAAQHSSSQRLLPPDTGEDYKRLRQFEVDRKGCLINRGDSFRRRTGSTSTAQASESRSGSIGSQGSTSGMLCPDNVFTDNDNNDGVVSYDVYVMGDTACGKSSLIRQSMTSEHRNPFMNDDEQSSNEMSVSVSIDGEVTEFIFFEGGTEEDQLTMTRLASAYILMYSVNSRSSFRHATQLLQNLRESAHTSIRPVILCGNKCDLARKRVITSSEATSLAKDNNCVAYEVSLALNHGVDELLVALLTEIKQSKQQQRHACGLHPSDKDTNDNKNMLGITKSLRRFSRRHRKQGHQTAKKTESVKLNGSQELAAHSYTNLVGRFTKYLKGTHARSCQDLQSSP